MQMSVIIPTYNSEETIERCLESLDSQTCKPFEIIVVDGKSEDSTTKIVRGFKNVRLIINRKSHKPGSSRNLAIEAVKGDVVLFFDSDCFADHRLLEYHVKCYEKRKDIVGVKGAIRSMGRSKISDFVQRQFMASQWLNTNSDGTMKLFHAGTNFSMYLSALLEKRFREDLVSCEDTELFIRINKSGWKVLYEPRAFVYHRHPMTIKELFEQRKWHGEGIHQLVKIHGKDFTDLYPLFSPEKYVDCPEEYLYEAVFSDHRLLCQGCKLDPLLVCRIRRPKLKKRSISSTIQIQRVTCLAVAAGILKQRTGIDYQW